MKYFVPICVGIMILCIVHIQIMEANSFPETSFALFFIEFLKVLFEKWFLF